MGSHKRSEVELVGATNVQQILVNIRLCNNGNLKLLSLIIDLMSHVMAVKGPRDFF